MGRRTLGGPGAGWLLLALSPSRLPRARHRRNLLQAFAITFLNDEFAFKYWQMLIDRYASLYRGNTPAAAAQAQNSSRLLAAASSEWATATTSKMAGGAAEVDGGTASRSGQAAAGRRRLLVPQGRGSSPV